MNYYPITDDKADMEFLFKRWKANNSFIHLTSIEINDLISWHTMNGYIKPFIYEHDGLGLLTPCGNKILIQPMNLFDGYEKEKILAPSLLTGNPVELSYDAQRSSYLIKFSPSNYFNAT